MPGYKSQASRVKEIYGFNKNIGYTRVNKEANESLEVGVGYWVLATDDIKYYVDYETIPSYQKTISENGWYLLGGISERGIMEIMEEDIGLIGKIFQYTPGAEDYETLSYECPNDLKQFWDETLTARIYEDREYGQWGLEVFNRHYPFELHPATPPDLSDAILTSSSWITKQIATFFGGA